MFGRKKTASKDKTTKRLQASGVYSMGHAPHPYIVGDETVEAVREKKIYSFRSAVWYTTVLSLLLFWFPPFGQMIAGYVGGRKAGVPWKGMLAAFAPMSVLFILFFLRAAGNHVSGIEWFLGLPSRSADYLSGSLPVFGPVVAFMSDYLQKFAASLWSGDYFIYPYVLTVIFGYVGGIMSLQHRREMEAEGREHPFFPVALPSIHMPVIMSRPEPAAAAAPGDEPETAPDSAGKGWKMKKDRKKGKW